MIFVAGRDPLPVVLERRAGIERCTCVVHTQSNGNQTTPPERYTGVRVGSRTHFWQFVESFFGLLLDVLLDVNSDRNCTLRSR